MSLRSPAQPRSGPRAATARSAWLSLVAAAALAACGGSPSGGGGNAAPTANAGADQTAAAGVVVNLDGSASQDPEGSALTYTWAVANRPTSSSVAIITNPNAQRPSFVGDVQGNYTLSLLVKDAAGNDSNIDAVIVTIAGGNAAPIAHAGLDRNVKAGGMVVLDGVASRDVNRDTLTYAWSLLSRPDGSSAVLSGADSALPLFKADAPGTYVARLVVNDGQLSSVEDTVTITAASGNVAPNAQPGRPLNVLVGQAATLNGGASADPNGDLLTFSWLVSGRPIGSSLSNLGPGPLPGFVADVAGSYALQLAVNDGASSSQAQTVQLTAGTGNVAPNANAGTYKLVAAGSTVSLSGSASSDANPSTLLTTRWMLTSKPAGSTATLSGIPGVDNPSFVADRAGIYVASLVVWDGFSNSLSDAIGIRATAAAGPFDGSWRGTTAQQGREVSFGASASLMSSFVFVWSLPECYDPIGSPAEVPVFRTEFNFSPTLLVFDDGTFDFVASSGVLRAVNGAVTGGEFRGNITFVPGSNKPVQPSECLAPRTYTFVATKL